VSIASEYDHAEQVVADVALLQDMAEGRLDDERVKEAAQVLLEHKRHELPSVSVAVAARLLGVSRTTVESWREADVLTAVPVRRRRYEISIESIVRVQALLEELRRLVAMPTAYCVHLACHIKCMDVPRPLHLGPEAAADT
jgi:DNA-binding transcriptional regulator YdaS (Cro superfamily)